VISLRRCVAARARSWRLSMYSAARAVIGELLDEGRFSGGSVGLVEL
jgi:hypothetical protein